MPQSKEFLAEIGKKTRFKAGKKQSEVARQGGYASQEKQHRDKAMKEAAQDLLWKMMPNGMSLQDILLNNLGAKAGKEEATISELVKTIEFLRDTSGQKPVEKKSLVDSAGEDVTPVVINIVGI